jgi:predicted RNA binding protein YcfA (HicA-like mRNA interferase family)
MCMRNQHPMSNKPSLTPREVLEILFRAGFEKVRTTGSHIRLRKEKLQVSIPFHTKRDIPKGTLSSIIRQSGLTEDEFFSYRKK